LIGGGTKFLDVEGPGNSNKVAEAGDSVDMHYRVLKIGKRSYDGLSGEGTVVFPRGYALEDDDKENLAITASNSFWATIK